MAEKKAKGVGRVINWVDNFQRRHAFAGFPYAVVKKYGDDEASSRGAPFPRADNHQITQVFPGGGIATAE
jgi:hypothetical protein